MILRRLLGSKAVVAVLLPVCLALLPSIGNAQQVTTYSGEAVVASVNALGIKTAISDTGQLPANGGSLSTQLAGIDLPFLLNLHLLTASTTGGSFRTSSQASVANVNLTAAGIGVSASVLTSNATAQSCGGNTPSVAGGSTIADLRVNGQSITVTGAPNQTVPLLVGSLVINEQISSVNNSPDGGSAAIVVNALHLKVAGIADVVISSSRAGVSCSQPNCIGLF